MRQNSTHQTTENDFSDSLRGWGVVGILFTIVVVLIGNITFTNMITLPIGALLVFLWVEVTKTPWREIGYGKPKSWTVVVVSGLIFGILFKLVMKAVVMPLFGADPINQTYHFLAGNSALLPAATWTMIAAGFGEETVFRGFLFIRLERLLGGRNSKIVIVTITSALFALAHHSQGIAGIEQAAITGLVFGSIYAASHSIWMIMIAHAAFDLTALGLIYWNLETSVAHIIFKS